MKKLLSLLLLFSLSLTMAGCRSKGMVESSPSPEIPAVTKIPEVESAQTPAPAVSMSPVLPESGSVVGADGKISGFEEGKLVSETDVPDIVRAVTERFPKAVIKSITHAIHEGAETYRIVMDGADSTEVYVDHKGKILGPTATPVQGSVGDTSATPQP